MDGRIYAEWAPLRKIFIHKPGIEMFFGLLNPSGSLYERPFSKSQARKEHDNLANALEKEFGVEVFHLKETILDAANENPNIRQKLINFAYESIDIKGTKKDVAKIWQNMTSEEKYLDEQHFFNILLLNPTFEISKKGEQTCVLNYRNHQPTANLFFMRDQQFMTDKGIVLCNLHSKVRNREPQITKFLWEEVLKIPIFAEIKHPGTIEGGEFIPMGNFAFVGIGSRTNQAAIDQLMALDFDYEEIAVVHQPMHPLVSARQPDPMINMHLDTYFNVAGKEIVIGSELLLKHAKVEIYHKQRVGYKKSSEKTTLFNYIKKKKLHLISLTTLEQLCYASNFLCIKDKKILAIEIEQGIKDIIDNLEDKTRAQPTRYKRLLEQAKKDWEVLKKEANVFPHKKEMYAAGIEHYPLILKNLTGGFGGAHCMTCALNRGL